MSATKTRKRNRSITSAGRTPIGASQTVKAIMVQITWTQAQVVTITALEDFTLECVAVNTLNGHILPSDVSIKVYAGTTLHFVKSSFDKLYYIGRVGAAGQVACTCPGHAQFHHECKHQPMILAAHNAKAKRACEREAAEFAQVVEALPDQQQEENVPEVPTECPQDASEKPAECSTEEALATASPEERRAIWKQARKAERERQKARGTEYWGKVDELRSQAS